MLQVILLILKIVGILLAVILGILLTVLLLLLFVPVRYKAFLSKRETVQVEAKVTWLLHLLSVPIVFRDNELSVKMKVLGITIKDLMAEETPEKKKEKPVKKQRKKKRKNESEETPEAEPLEPEAEKASTEPEKKECMAVEGPETGSVEEVTAGFKGEEANRLRKTGVKTKAAEILAKIRNLKYTIWKFCDKIKQILKKIRDTKEFILEERTKAALKLCFGQVLELLKKILPRKVKGEVRFGMDDPALTGEILGGISIFYPVFMDNVKVIPDFEQACLEGELFVKGRFRMAMAMRIAWKLFWDKNIRYVYRKLNL